MQFLGWFLQRSVDTFHMHVFERVKKSSYIYNKTENHFSPYPRSRINLYVRTNAGNNVNGGNVKVNDLLWEMWLQFYIN
jgi:hypothetical protein